MIKNQQRKPTMLHLPGDVNNNIQGVSSRSGLRKTMIPSSLKYLESPLKSKSIINNQLDQTHLFDSKNKSLKIQTLKHHLSQQHKLSQQYLKSIIQKFTQIIANQPTLLKLQQPITLIGDVHGQFHDLLKILEGSKQFQTNQKQKILFLGDYVDRGINSMQVMVLLMMLKVTRPNQVYMLRGNHESRNMTQLYNFKQQCCQKYDQDTFDRIMISFDSLPLAATINQKFFCVHGGLSQKLTKVDAINKLHRFRQVPPVGLFCDLLWADPTFHEDGHTDSPNQFNTDRGCSVFFNKQVVNTFLLKNQFKTIIRAHQVFKQGFHMHDWNGKDRCPPVITIFSAPNYCGSMGNLAAILRIKDSKFTIRQYRPEKIRDYMSSKLEVFAWSIPQWIRVLNEFSKNFINRIYDVHIPEGRDWKMQKKLSALLKYQQSKNNIGSKVQSPSKISIKFNSKIKSTQQQEDQTFQRALHYYKDQYPNLKPQQRKSFKSPHQNY